MHLTVPKHFSIQSSIFSVILSYISIYSELFIPYYTVLFQILCIFIFLNQTLKLPTTISLPALLISFALSNMGLFISSLITGTVFFPLINKNKPLLLQLLSCILQCLIIFLLFRVKRLKKGMPFLYKENYTFSAIIIGFLCFIIVTVTTYVKENNLLSLFTATITAIVIFAILLYQYWKKNLKNIYFDKLEDREREQLIETISQQSDRISNLEAEIIRLQKIIHNDNRLFPMFAHTLYTYLTNSNRSGQDHITYGKELLETLNRMSGNRKELLQQQHTYCRQTPSTKVISIDTLLSYMQQIAATEQIELQFNISYDLPYFIESFIAENDLHTLLTCLLDNAILATKYNNGNYILLTMCIIEGSYTISIFDSGIPFSIEVLKKWGIEQITTHAHRNGSGIGMLTIYEILRKYKASFLIREFDSNQKAFTKEITISFDQKDQYKLYTNRPEQELSQLRERTDLHIFPK